MKINEIILGEANTNQKIVGQAQAAANLKTNREKSAAWTKQMKATSAETEAPAAAAATPAATTAEAPATKPTPNYGAGGAGTPNVQVTPVSKVTGKATPGVGGAAPGADKDITLANPKDGSATGTPDQEVTLANPISATPAQPGAAQPAAGAAAAASGNEKDTRTPAVKGKSRFPNLARIGDGLGMVARGVGGALGSVVSGATDAINKGTGGSKYGSHASIQDTSGQGTPDIPAQPGTTTPTAAVATPAKTGQPVAATPVTTGQPAKGATPDLGAKPAAAGEPGKAGEPGATPDQDVTLANPIGKPGAEKTGQPQTQDSPVAEPAAAPATAAKGKAMSKQEILSWISRNDEDNAALQSFKAGITAAEKSGAGTATGDKPDYSKGGAGIQNVQVTPDKVGYAPKTAAPAANQTQLASKQYKKAPL
jgi:hypothetical protein